MRSSLVALQLLLALVLVRGTSVAEEKKECCGPGVPPEKSCCPKDNSTSQEPEKKEKEEPELNSEGPAKPENMLMPPEESNSEELEERAEGYRERMQDTRGYYETVFLKEHALDYFNKRRTDAHYRPIEDTDIKVKRATGTILVFTQFLVNTNCTKEEGQKFSIPWYDRDFATEVVPCVAMPKHEQKIFKCRVYMFLEAGRRSFTVIRQDCEPVVFWDDSQSEDSLDIHHLLSFPSRHFGHSF
ncbi:uncharacterized protein LOC113447450 [Pseudonaja textilis]|uniref:uncharacterized protein LOC113447450 n=1 Tax=Pseudonaja textilis TaxID=8673 RepID=UPI000EAA05A9|nr:uncharacterized protein LOC113447450 [Pseudonaja textilis]